MSQRKPWLPLHSDSAHFEIIILVLSHSLIRSFIRPRRKLNRLLHTACFTRALRYACAFARSLIRARARGTNIVIFYAPESGCFEVLLVHSGTQ